MNQSWGLSSFIWGGVAVGLYLVQLFVHGALNSQTAMIFPTDGCGQVLDPALKNWLRSAVGASKFNALIFAILLTFAWRSALWGGVFLLSTMAAVTSLVAFGWVNWRYTEFLTSCDIFFMGDLAVSWNILAAVLIFLSSAYRIKTLRKAV